MAPASTPPNDGFRAQASGWTYASWIVSGPARFRYVPGRSREVDDHPSMNLMVRRSAFQAVGGFDSAFYPGEDTKLCLELVHRGGVIRYEPGALVYHHRRPRDARPSAADRALWTTPRVFRPRVSGNLSEIPVLIPSLWLLWLVVAALASVWIEPVRVVFLGSLVLYGVAVAGSTLIAMRGSRSVGIGGMVAPTIVASHLCYGWHFLGGLVRPRP